MATQGDMNDNKAFASNFMLLMPDEVRVKGLYHVLTSQKVKKRRYFETRWGDALHLYLNPEGAHAHFYYRCRVQINHVMVVNVSGSVTGSKLLALK